MTTPQTICSQVLTGVLKSGPVGVLQSQIQKENQAPSGPTWSGPTVQSKYKTTVELEQLQSCLSDHFASDKYSSASFSGRTEDSWSQKKIKLEHSTVMSSKPHQSLHQQMFRLPQLKNGYSIGTLKEDEHL